MIDVVSLAPSSTATLVAMGAEDLLVGVTNHCEIDANRCEIDATDTTDATDIPTDRDVDPTIERVGGWLNPDLDRINTLDPDLVCTCDALQAELAAELRARGHDVFHQEPTTLSETLASFEALGEAVDRSTAGKALERECRDRIDAVRAAVSGRDRPVVYCEEWSEPPMAAGNWVPDAVRAAGGEYPFVASGSRSAEVTATEIEAASPDHVVLHVCGHGSAADPSVVRDRGWDLAAPVHVIDDSLLNQPSPALVDGIETLARVLHPDAFDDPTTAVVTTRQPDGDE